MKKVFYIILVAVVLFFPTLLPEREKFTPPEIPETKKTESVSLIFGGDIMMDRGVRVSVLKNLAGDYNRLFENLGMLKYFDIAFANLEGPISDKGRDRHNLYSFRMDPRGVEALKNAGMDIVSVANN